MNHLLRSHAPISELAWKQIDDEARERLEPALGARKLVDFSGPLGLAALGHQPRARDAARGLAGRGGLGARARGAAAGRAARRLHASRARELRDIDRGAVDADFESLDRAAHQIATAENAAVMHGWPDADQRDRRARHRTRSARSAADPLTFPQTISAAVERPAHQRRRRPLRARARPRALPPRDRDRRERRHAADRAPGRDPRRSDRLDPGARRRRRDQPARRRLPARVRAGPAGRLRLPRRRRGAPLHPGELQLPGRDARGSGCARALIAAWTSPDPCASGGDARHPLVHVAHRHRALTDGGGAALDRA